MAGLAGHRGLDALLVASVAELHQAVVVKPDPRDSAFLRRANQGGGARPQGTALGEADEVVERGGEIEIVEIGIVGPEFGRYQRMQQLEGQLARLQADILVLVFVDHGVDAMLAGRPRLAKGDVGAGDILHLNGAVLQHVAHPGSFVLSEPAHETARLAVRAAVLVQTGQGLEQRADKPWPQPTGGPVLEWPEVNRVTDHREQGVNAGAVID